MNQILSLTETDTALEGFKFTESLSHLKDMFLEWVNSKLDWIMTGLRKFAAKFNKNIFMKKDCAEDIEDVINANFENITELTDIMKDINASKDGDDVTADTTRVQEIASDINQGTNTTKTRVQEDNEFREENKDPDPTIRQKIKLKVMNLAIVKKLMTLTGGALKTFGDAVRKFFGRNKPNADEVESQHKPRLMKHMYLALGAVIGLIAVILTSVHFA